MNTIIVYADNKVTKGLISIFKAFGVFFEIKKEESPYDAEFVNMVLKSRNEKGGKILTEQYKQELFEEL